MRYCRIFIGESPSERCSRRCLILISAICCVYGFDVQIGLDISLCIRILDVDPLNIGTRVIYVLNINDGLAKDFKGFFSVRLPISIRCTIGKGDTTENILDGLTLTVSVVGKGFDGTIDFGFTVVIIVRTRQNLSTREQVDYFYGLVLRRAGLRNARSILDRAIVFGDAVVVLVGVNIHIHTTVQVLSGYLQAFLCLEGDGHLIASAMSCGCDRGCGWISFIALSIIAAGVR